MTPDIGQIIIRKPDIIAVDWSQAAEWRADAAYRDEEKLDGEFTLERFENSLVAAEAVIAPHPRPGIYVYDIAFYHGQDLRGEILSKRLPWLDELFKHRQHRNAIAPLPQSNWLRPATGHGAIFLSEVIAAGGEGIIRKRLDGRWGEGQMKAKREQVYYMRVIGFHGTYSANLEETSESMDARQKTAPHPARAWGNCVLRGNKREQCRLGSILKIVAYGQTPRGVLREPRTDSDSPTSWLKQY